MVRDEMKRTRVSVHTGGLRTLGAFGWAGGSLGEGLALRTSLPTSAPRNCRVCRTEKGFPGRGQALTCSWWLLLLQNEGPFRVVQAGPQRRRKQSLALPSLSQLRTHQEQSGEEGRQGLLSDTGSRGKVCGRLPRGSGAGAGLGRLFPEQLLGLDLGTQGDLPSWSCHYCLKTEMSAEQPPRLPRLLTVKSWGHAGLGPCPHCAPSPPLSLRWPVVSWFEVRPPLTGVP